MPAAIPGDERREIADAVRAGGRRNEIARKFGRSPGAVSKIAAACGVEFDRVQTEKATRAAKDYALAGRLELGNAMFDAVGEMLGSAKTPQELKDLATTFGILTDKRRLDDGEATNRTESVSPERRQRMKESLDEVAAQRRKSVAG